MTPTIIYGSESWTLTNRIKRRINAAEMCVIRRIEGKAGQKEMCREQLNKDEICGNKNSRKTIELIKAHKRDDKGNANEVKKTVKPRKKM